jgi:hypothetical protein
MDVTAPSAHATEDQHAASSAQSKAREVTDQAQQKAEQAKQRAGVQIREQLGRRSNEAGDQARSIAKAMRRSAEELRGEGSDAPANLVEQVSGKVEQVGDYLTSADSDKILRDLEDFARRQPMVVAGGAAALGFLAARFMGASSRRRYEGGRSGSAFQAPTAPAAVPPPLPAADVRIGRAAGGDLVDLPEPASERVYPRKG